MSQINDPSAPDARQLQCHADLWLLKRAKDAPNPDQWSAVDVTAAYVAGALAQHARTTETEPQACATDDQAHHIIQELLSEFAKDGHGGDFEDGEHPIVDSARAYLRGLRQAPAAPQPALADAASTGRQAPRAFRTPDPGTPWWQTAKDCGAWTDKQEGDLGYVHFGSVEALRVYTAKITNQARTALMATSLAAERPEDVIVTKEMLQAGFEAGRKYFEETGGNSPSAIYRAMYVVAPTHLLAKAKAFVMLREISQRAIADVREVFGVAETAPQQVVWDVIEYMDSWLSVYVNKGAEDAACTGSQPC